MSTATTGGSVSILQRAAQQKSRAQALWSFMKRKPLGAASASLILLIVFTAIFADVLAPYDPLFTHPEIRLAPPGWQHPFGTDDIGRDVFSRIIYGARVSLTIGLLGVAVSFSLGIMIGGMAGYHGGTLDLVVQRIIEVQHQQPYYFSDNFKVEILAADNCDPTKCGRWFGCPSL